VIQQGAVARSHLEKGAIVCICAALGSGTTACSESGQIRKMRLGNQKPETKKSTALMNNLIRNIHVFLFAPTLPHWEKQIQKNSISCLAQ
jgi:hypothetical protein